MSGVFHPLLHRWNSYLLLLCAGPVSLNIPLQIPQKQVFSIYFCPLREISWLCGAGVRVSGPGEAWVRVRRQCWNIPDILTTTWGPGTQREPGLAASHWSRCPGRCPPPGPSPTGWSCRPRSSGSSLAPDLTTWLHNYGQLCRHYSHTMGRLKSDKDDNYTYPWVFFDQTSQQKSQVLRPQARYNRENINLVWDLDLIEIPTPFPSLE